MNLRTLIMNAAALVTLGSAMPGNLSAGVITENLSGTYDTTGSGFWLGQSVTTPADGPWSDLSFNMISAGNSPYALGTLFLLAQAYSGTPGGLSSSTSGFVASTSSIVSGAWVFDSAVTVESSTTYYLYENAAISDTEVRFGINAYSGGIAYQANNSTSSYAAFASVDLQFQFQGTQAPSTPEPATAFSALFALGGIALLKRRKR